jgi:putative acetyltransferase
MIDGYEIRASTSDDLHAIEALYLAAFPEEDLLPLVRDLLKCQHEVLSLIGTVGASLIAHVIFTKCAVEGLRSDVALLGPLAVAPDWQRKGAGSRIVRHGLQQLQHDGVNQVFVLGNPAYYSRFGFSMESCVVAPYPLPAEWGAAWQSITLDGVVASASGTLSLPKPWLRKKLWSP